MAAGRNSIVRIADLHRQGVFLSGNQPGQYILLSRSQSIICVIIGLFLSVHPNSCIFGALHQESNVFASPVVRDKNRLLIDCVTGICIFTVQMIGVNRSVPVSLFIFIQGPG